jgi:hypothetical protein
VLLDINTLSEREKDDEKKRKKNLFFAFFFVFRFVVECVCVYVCGMCVFVCRARRSRHTICGGLVSTRKRKERNKTRQQKKDKKNHFFLSRFLSLSFNLQQHAQDRTRTGRASNGTDATEGSTTHSWDDSQKFASANFDLGRTPRLLSSPLLSLSPPCRGLQSPT